MAKTKAELTQKRREWVNKEFAEKTRGTHMSNSKKERLLKKLWRKAKREIK